MNTGNTLKTLTDLFDYALKEHGNSVQFFDKGPNKTTITTGFADLYEQAENLGIALMDLGLKPGDKMGLIADNRSEWALADMSVLMNGAVDVPRGTDSTPAEIEYILKHSEAKMTFFEDEKTLKKMRPILAKTDVTQIIILDRAFKADKKEKNIHNINDMIEAGKKLRAKKLEELKKRSRDIKEEDLFTIIYTSGTTGNPKGVMLCHRNMVYNTYEVARTVNLTKGDATLSILPVWHVFERAVDYAIIQWGATIAYTNIRDLKDDFQKVRPTFMVSAPRLWENIYMGVKGKLEGAKGAQKAIFNLGYKTARRFKFSKDVLTNNILLEKKPNPLASFAKKIGAAIYVVLLVLPNALFDKIVFSKLRGVIGGRLKGTISGGGALPPHVDEFFNAIGIPIYEGYGMTECAPIIAIRSVKHVVQRSVGSPMSGSEIKILDDKGNEVPKGTLGVIHVRGPQVMLGYYKNPEETKKVLHDGWMNTGDLGFFSFNNPTTISIRGRAKDTIVLVGGENIEPVPIENLLLEHDHINQVMVVGQDRKTLGALIWPDFAKLKKDGFAVQEGDDLNANEVVRKHFTQIIKQTISSENGFKSFEKVTGFQFLPKAMEVGDELTNLFKMKRNVITQKYAKLVDKIYSEK